MLRWGTTTPTTKSNQNQSHEAAAAAAAAAARSAPLCVCVPLESKRSPHPSEGAGVDGKFPTHFHGGMGWGRPPPTLTISSSHSDLNGTPRPAPRPRREMIPATANNTVGHASGHGGADPAELDARGARFQKPHHSPRSFPSGRDLTATAGVASRTLITGFGSHAMRPTANRHKTPQLHPPPKPRRGTDHKLVETRDAGVSNPQKEI